MRWTQVHVYMLVLFSGFTIDLEIHEVKFEMVYRNGDEYFTFPRCTWSLVLNWTCGKNTSQHVNIWCIIVFISIVLHKTVQMEFIFRRIGSYKSKAHLASYTFRQKGSYCFHVKISVGNWGESWQTNFSFTTITDLYSFTPNYSSSVLPVPV